MRKVQLVFLCLAVAAPVLAEWDDRHPAARRAKNALAAPVVADVDLRMEVLPPGSARATHAVAELRKVLRQSRRRGVGASAIVDYRATRILVIPVVGRAQGAGGTFFRSDITFVNWNFNDQLTQFIYLPNGNPAGTIIAQGTLPGDRPPFTIADFVGTQLNTSGVGSLLIFPILPNGEFDENAALDAHSRIYTPQPNRPVGTVSQQFPAVDPTHLMGEYEAVILGLRQDDDYRTNFGIVNLDEIPITFSVLMVPESAPPGTQLTEVPVTLQPLSMVHQPLPAVFPGQFNLIVGVEQDIPNDDQLWTTYGSSTDNETGDGWVSIGATILDDDDLDTLSTPR